MRSRVLSKPSVSVLILTALLACLLAPFSPAQAAPPAEELLRLLPRDVGMCLVVRDLRGHRERLAESPFVTHLATTPMVKAFFDSPDYRKIQGFNQLLESEFKTSLRQIHDEVLGQAIVFGYWPMSADKAEPDYSLFLIRAKSDDPQLLANLMKRLEEVQKKSGDLTRVEALTHQDVTYFRRVEKGGVQNYYLIDRDLLALSEHEPAIKRVIDHLKKPPAANPVADQLRDLGVAEAFFVLWFNPRSFDRQLEQHAKDAVDPEASFLQAFLVYWKQLEGAALSLRLDKDLELGLSVRMNTDRLPAPAQRFFASASQPTQLWTRFPDRTILAVASRTDFAAFLEMAQEFLPEATRQEFRARMNRLNTTSKAILDRDFDKDVLPSLGPDWGFYVTAPTGPADAWFPYLVLVVQVQNKDKEKPLDVEIIRALRISAASLSFLSATEGGVTLAVEMQDKVQVVSFVNKRDFPAGLQPAFAAKASCLVFASSPAAIAAFAESRNPPALPLPQGSLLLARLSLTEGQAYVKKYRPALVKSLAQSHGQTEEEMGKRLDGVLALVDLFEQVDLIQRTSPGHVRLTLQFRPTRALRKD